MFYNNQKCEIILISLDLYTIKRTILLKLLGILYSRYVDEITCVNISYHVGEHLKWMTHVTHYTFLRLKKIISYHNKQLRLSI